MRTPILALACVTLLGAQARAEPTTTFTAPYPCGTDEAARSAGLLVASSSAPRVPSQEPCTARRPAGTAVWGPVRAPSDGTISVHSNWSGVGALCLFASSPTRLEQLCGLEITLTIDVARAEELAVGVSMAEPGIAALIQSVDVTFE
jgi:hypothetical protein